MELISSIDATMLGGRRGVSLHWADETLNLASWISQLPARSGTAPEYTLRPLSAQRGRAWTLAQQHREGRLSKTELLLLSGCKDRFKSERKVASGDGSVAFDRPAVLLIDIDLTSRNDALTLAALIEERILGRGYPLALSPGGSGIKMLVPAVLGRGVPWNETSRALFTQAVFEDLVGDLAWVVKLDTSWAATCRAYLSMDVLHQVFEKENLARPVLIAADQQLESIFGEKRDAGEFPKIKSWTLPQISQATLLGLVDGLLAGVAVSRRLNARDDLKALAEKLGTFLEDNNPEICNGNSREAFFETESLRALSEHQRAAIQKRGSTLFLGQLEKLVAVLRFNISMRRWGINAPRSVALISHGLHQCGIDIHTSQVDTLLKRLVDLGFLIRTRPAQRTRSAAWYELAGLAKKDYLAVGQSAKKKPALVQPQPGKWHTTMMDQLRSFSSGDAWLNQLYSYPDLHAKPERLHEGIALWNNWARKKNLEPIEGIYPRG